MPQRAARRGRMGKPGGDATSAPASTACRARAGPAMCRPPRPALLTSGPAAWRERQGGAGDGHARHTRARKRADGAQAPAGPHACRPARRPCPGATVPCRNGGGGGARRPPPQPPRPFLPGRAFAWRHSGAGHSPGRGPTCDMSGRPQLPAASSPPPFLQRRLPPTPPTCGRSRRPQLRAASPSTFLPGLGPCDMSGRPQSPSPLPPLFPGTARPAAPPSHFLPGLGPCDMSGRPQPQLPLPTFCGDGHPPPPLPGERHRLWPRRESLCGGCPAPPHAPLLAHRAPGPRRRRRSPGARDSGGGDFGAGSGQFWAQWL